MGAIAFIEGEEGGKPVPFPKCLLILVVLIVLSSLSACSYPMGSPSQFLNPTEQLLISKAIKQSAAIAEPEISPGTSIFLDVTGLTKDQKFLSDILEGWLGKKGIVVRPIQEDATMRVRVVIQSLGVRRGTKFLGLPKTQTLWLPIALPELVLWKRVKQQGFSRFYLDMFDAETDVFLGTTEPYIGSVTQTTYTVFFFFDWKNTDLDQPLESF